MDQYLRFSFGFLRRLSFVSSVQGETLRSSAQIHNLFDGYIARCLRSPEPDHPLPLPYSIRSTKATNRGSFHLQHFHPIQVHYCQNSFPEYSREHFTCTDEVSCLFWGVALRLKKLCSRSWNTITRTAASPATTSSTTSESYHFPRIGWVTQVPDARGQPRTHSHTVHDALAIYVMGGRGREAPP